MDLKYVFLQKLTEIRKQPVVGATVEHFCASVWVAASEFSLSAVEFEQTEVHTAASVWSVLVSQL
jgi:hypothetical protein